MADVWILVDELPQALDPDSTSTLSMIAALKDAIATYPSATAPDTVHVLPAADWLSPSVEQDAIVLPLTLALPETLDFPQSAIYRACDAITELRQQVTDQVGLAVGDGQYWLPIVFTVKGPLYAEAIAPQPASTPTDPSFIQPLHLTDRQRQPLYHLGIRLLTLLQAPPAVYLLKFGLEGDRVWFDRLLPFPGVAAIASLGVQTPNLYTCHWQCIMGQPIFDLSIPGTANYITLPTP